MGRAAGGWRSGLRVVRELGEKVKEAEALAALNRDQADALQRLVTLLVHPIH